MPGVTPAFLHAARVAMRYLLTVKCSPGRPPSSDSDLPSHARSILIDCLDWTSKISWLRRFAKWPRVQRQSASLIQPKDPRIFHTREARNGPAPTTSSDFAQDLSIGDMAEFILRNNSPLWLLLSLSATNSAISIFSKPTSWWT